MAFASFKEYLDHKKKTIEKPATEIVADYKGPNDKAPPKSKGEDGKPAPYKNGENKAAQKAEKGGFAEKGSQKPYSPDTKKTKTHPTWPKATKTEAFLEKTKNMSLQEFADYMLEECGCNMPAEELPTVTAYTAGKFHPHPPEAIKYVVVLANKNERVLENLVHELKREGGFPKLLKAIMEHPEANDELSAYLGDENEGMDRSKAFARAMNDTYVKFTESVLESVGPPIGVPDDEDMEDEDDSDEEGEDYAADGEDGEGMDDEMNHPDDDDTEEDEEGEEETEPPVDDGSSSPSLPSNPMKKKKRLAHHNVVDAMGSYEPMVNYMKSYMSKY